MGAASNLTIAELTTTREAVRPSPIAAVIDRNSGRLQPVQYLRGFAALAVLIYHASQYVSSLRHYDTPYTLAASFGVSGVAVFFAISGALMAILAQRATLARFLAHRILRIYPIYWIIAGLVFLTRRWLGDEAVIDPLALALVPGGPRNYLLSGVEWTLQYEITFYIMVFGLTLLRAGGRMHIFALAWIALIGLVRLVAPELQRDAQYPPLWLLPLSERSLALAMGMLVPWLLRLEWAGRPRAKGMPAGLIEGVLGIALLAAAEFSPTLQYWLLAAGSMCLVAAAMAPRPPAERIRPLKWLGDYSYALYLCHFPIIAWVGRAASATMDPLLLLGATILVPLLASVPLGWLDLTLYRFLKSRTDRAAPVARYTLVAFLFAIVITGTSISIHTSSKLLSIGRASAALGARLEMNRPIDTQGLVRAAVAAGLKPLTGVTVFIEVFDRTLPTMLYLRGWAVVPGNAHGAETVLVFLEGKFLEQTVVRDPRSDVLTALNLAGSGITPGFHATPSLPRCSKGAQPLLLLVTPDGRFAPLALAVPFTACEE